MAEIGQINGVWEAILWAIAWIVEKFYYLAQDWGLAIILFTLISKLILLPISIWVHYNGINYNTEYCIA